MDDFSSCKVGDKLWSYVFGWATVTQILYLAKRYITVTTERGNNSKYIYANGAHFPSCIV